MNVVEGPTNEDRESPDPADERFERLEARLEHARLLPDDEALGDPAETSIAKTLDHSHRPLDDPSGFERAHRQFVRGLEALHIHGRRPATSRYRVAFLRVLGGPMVQAITAWIIDLQLRRVIRVVGNLYVLREASAKWGGDDHRLLRRARIQLQLVASDLRGNTIGWPFFLAAGAIISGLISTMGSVVAPALRSKVATGAVILLAIALLIGLAAAVLRAATVARKRIRLALSGPLKQLYGALGNAGPLPQDRSYLVALLGITFLALAAIAVPAGILVLVALT